MLLQLNKKNVVLFIIYTVATMTFIVVPTIETSNSFTPITCYDCPLSSSSSSSSSSSYSYSPSDNAAAARRGLYVGSVMAEPLDDHFLLKENDNNNAPYNPASSSLLGISSGYSVSSRANVGTISKANPSPYRNSYYSNLYQKKASFKDRYHPTTFDVSQSSFRRPTNSFTGALSGNAAVGITGGVPANAAFRDQGGGLGFGVQSATLLGSQGLGAGVPGSGPFGSAGGVPGASSFGSAGGGIPGGRLPNSGFFQNSGAGLGGSFLGNSQFGSLGGGLREGMPDSAGFGSPGNGFGGNQAIGGFGTSGGSFPGGAAGTASLGASGVKLPDNVAANAAGLGQDLGQQVIGDFEMESGVGEVMQPAQTDLKPEVIQSSTSDMSYNTPQQPGYAYGYPPSLYQQPLPDITEPPRPTAAINEVPPPLPVNKPATVVTQGTSVQGVVQGNNGPPLPPPPPVPVGVSPPIYGYYYIGRKAWYVPLYFCVYFIVYVGCLILKHIYRHKAHFPEHLHDAVVNARTNNDYVYLLTESVMTAFDKFTSKF